MIVTVANYTLREIIKSKIMVLTVILAISIVIVSYVASELSFGVTAKVALEFGVGCISLASLGISILLGANLIYHEIENRTVYMVLARPIGRTKFILGKLLGFFLFLILFITILSFLTLTLYFLYDGIFNNLLILTFINILVEAFIILLLIVLFTLIANQTLAFIFSLSLLFGGYSIGMLRELGVSQENGIFVLGADIYGFFFPDFDRINLRPYLIYEQKLNLSTIFMSTTYGIVYSLILIFLIVKVFEYKNLD